MLELKHCNIRIKGRVQGVSFRYQAEKKANKLNLKGFIRNEPDGSVYLEVEGEENKIKEFLEWSKEGPTHANVNNVIVRSDSLQNFDSFEIK